MSSINPQNRVSFTWDKLTPFTTSIGQTKGVNTGFSGHSFLDGGFGYLPPTLGESAGFIDDRDQYRMRADYVWTVKPNLLMSFRAAVIANPNRRVPWYPLSGKTATFGQQIGLKGLGSPRAPVVNISGFSTLGSGFSNGRWPNSTVPVDLDFAWSKGRTTLSLAQITISNIPYWSAGRTGPGERSISARTKPVYPEVSNTGAGIASMMLAKCLQFAENSQYSLLF